MHTGFSEKPMRKRYKMSKLLSKCWGIFLAIGLISTTTAFHAVAETYPLVPNSCTFATYTVTIDNSNCPTIDIIVDITALGSASTLNITESSATDSVLNVGIGTYTLTGYSPGDGVIAVFITDSADPACQDIGVASIPEACPPANDLCSAAQNILEGSTVPGTTVGATTNGQPFLCGTAVTSAGVWYTYTSNFEGEEITIDLCGAPYDAKMSVYTGGCGSFVCVGGSDDVCIDDPVVSFTSTSGGAPPSPVQYFIYVHGFGGATGTFDISLNSNAAPLSLLTFEGEVLEHDNRLMWTTAYEENTSVHVLERSIDGQSWDALGAREASGFSQTEQHYEYIDLRPLAKAFYRLRTIDNDGSESFSDVITLERRQSGLNITNVYPIPTDESLTVEFETDENETAEIAVVDMMGRMVHQEFVAVVDGANIFSLDMAHFSYGVYTLVIKTDRSQRTQRIIKKNSN